MPLPAMRISWPSSSCCWPSSGAPTFYFANTGIWIGHERVTPRRAPRRSGRAMQTSLRGCDGEMDLSTSGLFGGRTRLLGFHCMANSKKRLPTNIVGNFFVDSTCIDCDTCRQLAPASFVESGDYSSVYRQPSSRKELLQAYQALLACPVGSIGA